MTMAMRISPPITPPTMAPVTLALAATKQQKTSILIKYEQHS